MTPETYTLFSNACWRKEHIPALVAWLRGELAALIDGHKTLRTKDLFEIWGVEPEQSRVVTNALYAARKSGLVDDCFRRDPTKRHMGKPLILWTRPLATSPETPASGTVPEISPEEF